MTICILISFQIGLLVQSVLTALQPVVFGISVLLIHARIGLGWARDSYLTAGPTPTGISLNITTTTRQDPGEYDSDRGKWSRGSTVV